MVFDHNKNLYRRGFVLAALALVLIMFLLMIRDLIITVILAATFSGLLFPLRVRLEQRIKGRRTLATVIVYVFAIIVIGIPFLAVLVVAAKQAIQVSDSLVPYIKAHLNQPPENWLGSIADLPLIRELEPFRSKILEGVSQLVQTTAGHLSKVFTAAAFGAVDFIFKLFIGLYAGFFFLKDGDGILARAQEYVPLSADELSQAAAKGLTILKATMKSLLVIGVIQGVLVGLAFWVLGIQAPVFWGVIVAVLSVIPGVGAPLIWIPAAVFLLVTERFLGAAGLTLWGTLPVGLTDNFLRPLIIGKDVDLPEVYILLSILGGLAAFGIFGIILGPVLASLLISAFEIYRKTFQPALK